MFFVFLFALSKQLNNLKAIKDGPQATPSVIPISIRSGKMTRNGDVECGSNNCPNINNDIKNYHPDAEDTYNCGETCTATTGSLEYTFKGEKFGIFGVYSPNKGKYNIYLNGEIVSEVDSSKSSEEKYSLVYLSDNLQYKEYTVKIEGQGNQQFEIYKLVFWPSLKAKRLNISEFALTGTWKLQSDLIGGVRAYTETDSTTDTATAKVHFSKVWVYGTICSWHNKFRLDIGTFQHEIDSNGPYDDDTRLDSALLYESVEFSPSDSFVFTMTQTSTLNYVYYIEEAAPVPTPSALPISIRSAKMTRTGEDISCSQNDCPGIGNNVDNYHPEASDTYECGETCSATSGSFEYKFKGVKFGIFCPYSLENGKYNVLLDGQKVTEVDLGKQPTKKYTLSYVSEDLEYREHTVKIEGQGSKKFQVYKLIFWPWLNAKRINITEFTKVGTWKYETDLIGGVRAYAEVDQTSETATAQIRFSKIWIYGTICSWHGTFNVDFGDYKAELNEYGPYINDETRLDSALLFESPEIASNHYSLQFSIQQSVTLNYVYYTDDLPKPTPTPIPISIRSAKMTRAGDVECSSNNCPNINNDINNYNPDEESTYNCGETCTATTGSFEYSFTGVKFGIFGVYSPEYGKYDISIDGTKVVEVDSNKETSEKYSLVYLSEDLSYHEHTVKIQGKENKQFEIYKLVYWPTLNAKRMNITEFDKTGNWFPESDLIGGVRAYTKDDDATETATAKIRFSKLWIYGTICSWHGKFNVDFGDLKTELNENNPLYTTDETRLDSVLLFESPEVELKDYTLLISLQQTTTLYYIYYIDELPPAPSPTPSAIPISISFNNMTKDGTIKYYYSKLPCNEEDPGSPSAVRCGKKSITSTGSFEYTFYGEKFAIVGAFSPTYGKFTLEIDSKITEVNTNKETFEEYAFVYFSEDLQYKEHTIKVQGNGDEFQLHKLVFWPSLRAKRMNITDFVRTGDWKQEPDYIGGIRAYTTQGGVNETATATIHCSHLWVYGTKCSWHGKLYLSYGSLYEVLDEKVNEGSTRYDMVKLYESPDLNTDATELKFTIMDTATLNFIYYIEVPYSPNPTPSAIPISIRMDQMTQTGEITCYTTNCPDTDLDSPSAYQCGVKCSSKSGSFTYSFTGVKFGIIGATASNYDSFNILIDGSNQPIEIGVNNPQTDEFSLLYTSEELSYSQHTVTIQGNSGLFKLYKLVYWPYLNAKRVNITDFERKGDWKQESDQIGGIRAYTTEGGVNETATATIHGSRFWVYGTKCSWHGNLYISIGDTIKEEEIDASATDPYPIRFDSVMMYESKNFVLDSHVVSFTVTNVATINYVYYLDAPPPSETPTPSYTPEPTPKILIYYDENCTLTGNNKRCFHENNDHESYNVQIIVSSFTNLDDIDQNGGAAIHLINTGFLCNNTEFSNCNSENSFGGAVYLENNYIYEVDYILENLKFDHCEAKCGGALYIYAVSERSEINIKQCEFIENSALAPKTDEYFGGSAVFLSCVNANLFDNVFKQNKGTGGAFKVYQKFKDVDTGALFLYGSERRSILILRCAFEITNESDCSLFYFGGRSDVSVQLKESIFNGNLSDGSHHINGFVTSKEATKLNVENCKFSDDFKKSIRFDGKNDYISINLRNQIFEYQKVKKSNKLGNDNVKVCYISVTAVFVVCGIAFTLKRRNSNESNDNNEPLSMTE